MLLQIQGDDFVRLNLNPDLSVGNFEGPDNLFVQSHQIRFGKLFGKGNGRGDFFALVLPETEDATRAIICLFETTDDQIIWRQGKE